MLMAACSTSLKIEEPQPPLLQGVVPPEISDARDDEPFNLLDRSTAVFYRLQDFAGAGALASRPVSLYVNGVYEGSLEGDALTTTVLCPGTHHFGLQTGAAKGVWNSKVNKSFDFQMAPGIKQYFRVTLKPDGSTDILKMPVDLNDAELRRITRKTSASSRLNTAECAAIQSASAPSYVTEGASAQPVIPRGASLVSKYSLKASGLFVYKKTSVSDITTNVEFERMLGEIAKTKDQFDRVEVFAYADPVGGAAYNLKLSEARAKSVAQALQNAGVVPEKIRFTGRGQANLLVADCAEKTQNKADLNACNEPNRRIEVLVIGATQ